VIEMSHRKAENEKQDFRKKSPGRRKIRHLSGILASTPTKSKDNHQQMFGDFHLKGQMKIFKTFLYVLSP